MQCEIWQLFCMLWRRGGGPSFCLLVFALHCFIVFWLSHRHPSAPMTHQDSILLSSALLFPSYPLFLCLSLTFQRNPRCLWKKKKKPPQLTGARDTEQHSAFCKHTRSYRRCKKNKNVNTTRARCKNVLIWYRDVRKTKQDAGSSEWRSAKQQLLLNLCGPCCTQWQGFPPASLSSIRGAKCVTRGGL